MSHQTAEKHAWRHRHRCPGIFGHVRVQGLGSLEFKGFDVTAGLHLAIVVRGCDTTGSHLADEEHEVGAVGDDEAAQRPHQRLIVLHAPCRVLGVRAVGRDLFNNVGPHSQ